MNETFALGVIRSLAEAIKWCAHRVQPGDPANSLRTVDLAPAFAHRRNIEEYGLGLTREEVESLVKNRSERLAEPTAREAVTDLEGGRLLGYQPDENLQDGASELASNGFFDLDEIAPWDTWVAYVDDPGMGRYLLSWVPPQLLAIVGDGIWVNAMEAVWWFDLKRPQLADDLVAAGLDLSANPAWPQRQR